MLKQLIKKVFPFLFIVPIFSNAQSVDLEFAKEIAAKFIESKQPDYKSSKQIVRSARTENSDEVGALYHVIHTEPKGFVVVAGNKRFDPILAYSTEHDIDFSAQQNAAVIYLKGMAHSIEKQLKIVDPIIEDVVHKWDALENGATLKTPDIVVGPLTTTTWGQETYYNAHCPTDQFGIDDKTYAGCITLSLAQLLKYHGHPARGNGTNQYDDLTYGTQTVNFGNTLYPWDSMPDELLNYDDNVARAIYHSALSINTEFSTIYTAAYFTPVRTALVYNWLFDRSAQFVKRSTNPTGIEWYDLIESELDQARPTLMRADAVANGAHSWLIDGYDDEGFYHMNWGWGGSGNGWYKDISVQWEWIEGGTNAFYNDMDMIYSVFPAATCLDYEAEVDIYVPGKTETSATVALLPYAGYITNQFRLRKVGTTTWIESDISNELSRLYEDLTAGTEYEFQVRAMCSETVWNNYSNSFTFTTPGVACVGLPSDQISAGGISTDQASISSGQPYGQVDNQFQYRILNSATWTDTDVSTVHFRDLTGLQSGTTYEFRVRHRCANGEWSDFSEIDTFTTAGDPPGTGLCTAPTLFLATSITNTYAYLIGSDFTPGVSNQFRYRIDGTATWTETSVNSDNYRLIQNLVPGTQYAFETREACSDGSWSPYSGTNYFSTTGTAPVDDVGPCDAPASLLSSSTTDHSTYIYLGYGSDEENQFRYRAGSNAWVETNSSDIYYRFIENLSAGTTYEFQARSRCENGLWSNYSDSETFTTTGSTEPTQSSCSLEQSALDNDEFYFYYFLTGFAQLEIQWRYTSTSAWSSPYATVNHYAAIRNDLGIQQDGAQVRVRIQCGDGTWTDYSDVYQLP